MHRSHWWITGNVSFLVWMNSHYCSPAKTVTQCLLCLILLFHKTERCTVCVNHTMAAKLSADYRENQSVCRCLQSCVRCFYCHVGSLSGSLISAAPFLISYTFSFCILVTFGWSSADGAGHLLVAWSVVWSLASEWVSVNVCASQHTMLYEVLWVLMLLDLFRVKWWI